MSNFLDVIPDDIHDIIARQLLCSINFYPDEDALKIHTIVDDKYLDTVFEYAMKGPAQRGAVLRAMSHRMIIAETWREQSILNWISLAADELLELNILDAPRFSFPGAPPKLPKLRKAIIDVLPEQFALVKGCAKLKELDVFITSTRPWDDLVSTIDSLPLKELSLTFSQRASPEIVQLKDLSKLQLMNLCAACPKVENFGLLPDCCLTSDACEMIQGMTALKRLTLTGDVEFENHHVPLVRGLPELQLYNSSGIRNAERFNTVISGLGNVSNESDSEEVSRLASFTNLRKLEILLSPGAEEALIGVIGNVEKLSLSWSFKEASYVQDVNGDSVEWCFPFYYEPDGTVLERILRSTPKLRSLRISDAILISDVIERMLKIVGTGLEDLEICHDWQKEDAPRRMERILKAIIHYCPKLKTLNFLENDSATSYFILSAQEKTKRCFRALEQALNQHGQLFRLESYMKIRYILRNRFIHEQPEDELLWDDILP